MSIYSNCPRCGRDIPQDGYSTGFAICTCGWCDPTPETRASKTSEKKTIRAMIIGSLALVVVYGHLVSWGSYSLEIPIVKLQKLTGTLSTAGYVELAETCISLAKFSCAKDTYLGLYEDKGDLNGLAGLAKLQVRLGETNDALATSARYFKAGGTNSETALNYGRLLESSGQFEPALQYYGLAISASGNVLPVQATTAKVLLLIKIGRYENAYADIESFYASAGNAKGYLNVEHEQLVQYLGKQAKSGMPGHHSNHGKHVVGV
jgi:hypothetical protein